MSTITIQIDNHEQPYTVSEMRRRLAQVLSKLNGDQTVSFSFNARLENYTPNRPSITKIPDAPDTRHCTMPATLGMPYGLSDLAEDAATKGGLWGYAEKMKGPRC